jgi:hypothetical protein
MQKSLLHRNKSAEICFSNQSCDTFHRDLPANQPFRDRASLNHA